MSERGPVKGWWHTLPGMLTAVAALLTAVTGLFVALSQTGWLSRVRAASPAASGSSAVTPAGAQPSAVSAGVVTISLPVQRDYRLGDAVFTLLGATLSPRNNDANTLAVRVRMRNTGPYPANFWDEQFRLLVDGVAQPPVEGVNEVVAAQAVEEGELMFAVPRTVTRVQFRVSSADEQSDVAFDLSPPPGP